MSFGYILWGFMSLCRFIRTYTFAKNMFKMENRLLLVKKINEIKTNNRQKFFLKFSCLSLHSISFHSLFNVDDDPVLIKLPSWQNVNAYRRTQSEWFSVSLCLLWFWGDITGKHIIFICCLCFVMFFHCFRHFS